MKIKTLKTVLGHPLNKGKALKAFITLVKRGIVFRLHRHPVVYPFIENTWLVVERGMSSAELQLFTTLYDTEEMLFLLHYLRPGDGFVDVGANVGVYTILTAGVAGVRVDAIEPIPSTFGKLRRNVVYNGLTDRVVLHNVGVGNREEKLYFSEALDAVNHVVGPDYAGRKIQVPVTTLNRLLADQPVTALKIDVEGFEANVINGAAEILKRPELNVLIMETNGLTDQYEYGQDYLHKTILSYGFEPVAYDPFQRTLTSLDRPAAANTVYVKDRGRTLDRIRAARQIRVGDRLI